MLAVCVHDALQPPLTTCGKSEELTLQYKQCYLGIKTIELAVSNFKWQYLVTVL